MKGKRQYFCHPFCEKKNLEKNKIFLAQLKKGCTFAARFKKTEQIKSKKFFEKTEVKSLVANIRSRLSGRPEKQNE